MFNNTNHYNLWIEIVDGLEYYYVSFMDEQAVYREIEVSRPVYLEFLRFVKTERNLRRWDERHTEQSDLTNETLNKRALNPAKDTDEIVFDDIWNEKLRLAIQELPEIQRRRFILYYEFGLTYEQIAKIEGCTKMAVKYSVDKAKEKVLENVKFL